MASWFEQGTVLSFYYILWYLYNYIIQTNEMHISYIHIEHSSTY